MGRGGRREREGGSGGGAHGLIKKRAGGREGRRAKKELRLSQKRLQVTDGAVGLTDKEIKK